MVPRGCGVRRWQNVKQNLPLYWGSPWKVLKSCWLHTPFELKISPYFNGVFPFLLANLAIHHRGQAVCSLVTDSESSISPPTRYLIVGIRKKFHPRDWFGCLVFPFFLLRLSPILPSRELCWESPAFKDIRGEGPLRVMGSWCHFSRGRNKTSKTWAFQESPTSLTVDLSKTQGSLVKI